MERRKIIGIKTILQVEGLGDLEFSVTGQLPGPVDILDTNRSKIDKTEMAGIWGNLETDAILSIGKGGKGLGSLNPALSRGELIKAINLEQR